jgi:hypothetical protein
VYPYHQARHLAQQRPTSKCLKEDREAQMEVRRLIPKPGMLQQKTVNPVAGPQLGCQETRPRLTLHLLWRNRPSQPYRRGGAQKRHHMQAASPLHHRTQSLDQDSTQFPLEKVNGQQMGVLCTLTQGYAVQFVSNPHTSGVP